MNGKVVSTGMWDYVRRAANYQSNGPATDVSSTAIRCYPDPANTKAKTYTVKAGDSVGFVADAMISHPGPLQFYLAKVPEGQTAETFDGSGQVWFKIFGQGPVITGGALTWPSNGKFSVLIRYLLARSTNEFWDISGAAQVQAKLPASLPSGEYLLRVEHIGLHSAAGLNGAQFYIACAQIKVEGGGSGKPGPLVAFPGAYKATDPGIQIGIYYPVPTSYTLPGPAVWSG